MLERAGMLWWRNPVQGTLYSMNGKTFMRPSPIAGFPDVSFLGIGGILYCVEFKAAKGRLSDKQKKWLNDLNTAGAKAYMVKTPLEMAAVIEESLGGDIQIN